MKVPKSWDLTFGDGSLSAATLLGFEAIHPAEHCSEVFDFEVLVLLSKPDLHEVL